MDMQVHDALCTEVLEEMSILEKADIGSDVYKSAVDGITKLVDRINEIKRIQADCDEKAKASEFDAELRRKQQEDEQRNRLIGHILTGASIVIPAIITIWGTVKSFEFEQTGTVTTLLGRKLVGRCVPNK